jgi:hypothetical protein
MNPQLPSFFAKKPVAMSDKGKRCARSKGSGSTAISTPSSIGRETKGHHAISEKEERR